MVGLFVRRIATVLVAGSAVVGLAVLTPGSIGVAAAAPAGWSLVTSPNRGADDNQLLGVSCADATHCAAVGVSLTGFTPRTLVEQLTNGAWKLVASPNRGAGTNNLAAVSCAVAATCVAVGWYGNGSQARTLVEQLAAGKWSVVSSPNTAGTGQLRGVSCPDATHCYAVGQAGSAPLIETLSAGKWVKMTNPAGSAGDVFESVSCATATRCMAVGHTSGALPASAELKSGTWTRLTTPSKGPVEAGLHSVSCPTATRCYATGYYYLDGSTFHTLTERYASPSWKVQASPNHGTDRNMLLGAACASTTSCVGVGYAKTGASLSFGNQTLVLNGNGTKWTLAASPNRGAATNVLQAADCLTATKCVAVGYDETGTTTLTAFRTLILTATG